MSSTTLVLVLLLTTTGIAPPKRSLKKFHDTRACSSPRKSLVKGERFIRSEEKPEYNPTPSPPRAHCPPAAPSTRRCPPSSVPSGTARSRPAPPLPVRSRQPLRRGTAEPGGAHGAARCTRGMLMRRMLMRCMLTTPRHAPRAPNGTERRERDWGCAGSCAGCAVGAELLERNGTRDAPLSASLAQPKRSLLLTTGIALPKQSLTTFHDTQKLLRHSCLFCFSPAMVKGSTEGKPPKTARHSETP